MKREKTVRVVIMLFAIVVASIFLSATAFAETSGNCGAEDDNLTWVLDDSGVLTISGSGEMEDFNGGTGNWHWGTAPKKVVIESGVTSIGEGAFKDCNNLKSISIPNSVTKIGPEAFASCSLTTLNLPNTISEIGDRAFADSSLTTITLPQNLSCIKSGMFEGSALTEITLQSGITTIEDYAFSWCTKLTDISLPEGVTTIGNNAFEYCMTLTDLTLPDSLTSIGNYAFSDCCNLMHIAYSNHLTSIGDYTFSNCSELNHLQLPDSLASIGRCAFGDCFALTEITIPSGVTSMGDCAFSGCTGLENVVIMNGAQEIGCWAFENCPVNSVSIPGSVTIIGEGAFESCELQDISILEGVQTIGASAFANSAIKNLTIPGSVTSIGNSAFSSCGELSDISFSEGVQTIGAYAFEYCNIRNLTIPASVRNIGAWAFNGAPAKNILFLLDDVDVEMTIGDNWISSTPTVYCHIFTAPDVYFSSIEGANLVYLEDVGIEEIQTITLPEDFSIACGETAQIHASVFPDDGTPVTWSSSEPGIVSVQDGTVTAVNAGSAVITATMGSASQNVTVEAFQRATSFELMANELWVLAKDDVEMSVASYEPEVAKAFLTWSSSNSSLATVDETGLVKTIKPGDVTITATSEMGVSADCVLHLCYPVSAVALSAPDGMLFGGMDLQLIANVTMSKQTCVNHLVTFTSSDETVATVDSETGLVHGVAEGTVTITATSRSNKSDSVVIRVRKDLTGLDVMWLPSDLLRIESEAFSGLSCEAVIIPEGCTSIGSKAFANCSRMVYVYVPETVTSIAADAFEGSSSAVIDRD